MSSLLWNNGSLIKRGPGSAILTSANEYLGTTTINGGILSTPLLANGGAVSGIGMSSNAAANLILNGGTLQYSGGATSTDHLFTLTTSGGALDASGNGPLTFSNTGAIALSGSGDRRLTLTGTNTGANTLASVLGDGGGPTSLTKSGNGTWVLTGTNTYSGVTNVTAGRLVINGDQSGATGAVSVASGATLNGTGTIGGNVVIGGGGTFAPGNPLAPGTLTIDGDLALGSGSSVSYQLGQATVAGGALNDLTVVRGNLTLDGTLNVTATGGDSFDPGIYHLFNYDGLLTNNGLTVGSVPTSDYFLQTAVPHQINLINTAGLTLTFWDGGVLANRNNNVVDGGSGVWQSSASAIGNWTTLTGSTNAPWTDGAFAIFEGTAGTVSVDNSLGQVSASGLDFSVGGYVINGEPLTLTETNAGTGRTTIRVGDGSASGASSTATIASLLQGSTQLVKADLGTLILNSANTYTGGTAITGGTLQVASDANLGAAAGSVSFNGGTLATTATFSTARATTLDAGGGTFDVANATTLTMSAAIGGEGALNKRNTGVLVLTGANTYSGGTTIAAGTLAVGGGGTSGSLAGNVTNHGTLVFNRGDTVTYGGVISGTGAVSQAGAGTTVLTGTNIYTGGTTISAGTLQLGNGTTNGSIIGNVTNNAVLAFKPATGTTMTFGGVISGTGAIHQTGTGTTFLTGANTYSGGTAVNGGTLQVSNDANLGAAAGALSFNGGTLVPIESFSTARATTLNAGGGTFDVADATTLTLSGAIGGPGTLSMTNTGTLVLSGTSTYTVGCVVPVEFDDALVASLRKGAILNITATTDNGREAAFKISLNGFGSALARTADLSK